MLRVIGPATRPTERRYVLDTVLRRWLGHDFVVEESDSATSTTIELPGSQGRLVVADHLLGLDDFAQLHQLESGDHGFVTAKGPASGPGSAEVPVLWGPLPSSALRPMTPESDLHVDIDIFGTAFALVTGLAELAVAERDGHGRVPMASTILGRRNLVDRPVVDEQVAVLAAAMTMLWPNLAHRRPTPRSIPTHDIDRLRRYGTTAASAPAAVLGKLRTRQLRAVAAAAKAAFDVHARGKPDPFFSFDQIMDVSEELGVTSNFYFIPRYRRNDGTPPSRYSLRANIMTGLLGRIDQRGHAIGIHPGYDSFRDTAELRDDAAELRSAAAASGVTLDEIGGRHHYLRWDPQRSPRCWDDAGLAHDSSFGFAERPGFRAGTSRSFLLWDHGRGCPTTVEERPLIWMDASIFADDPAGLESELVMSEALELRDRCLQHGGDFTFLMHNDGFAAPGGREAFRALIAG